MRTRGGSAVNARAARVLARRRGRGQNAAMTFLRSTVPYVFSLALVACGSDSGGKPSGDTADDAGAQSDDSAGDGTDTKGGTTSTAKDAGGSTPSAAKDAGGSTPSAAKDASASKPESRDSGSSPSAATDAATAQSGGPGSDAGMDDGDGVMIPNLFPDDSDAGSSTSSSGSGTRDVNGPCKDLDLVCFDIFDMWIINPDDCATCNSGMGCEGCAIPFAY